MVLVVSQCDSLSHPISIYQQPQLYKYVLHTNCCISICAAYHSMHYLSHSLVVEYHRAAVGGSTQEFINMISNSIQEVQYVVCNVIHFPITVYSEELY